MGGYRGPAIVSGYVLAWLVGRSMAGPADGVILWSPTAGVALAAWMVLGGRAAPALLLGTLLTAGLSHWLPLQEGSSAAGGLTAAWLGDVAPLLGTWLASRRLERLPGLISTAPVRQTLRALVWVLAAALFSAVVVQWAAGWPEQGVVGQSPWTLWLEPGINTLVSQIAGMLLVTPPLLLWLHPGMRHDPVAGLAFPILSIGLGLTLVGSHAVDHLGQMAGEAQFRGEAQALGATLQKHLDLAARDLEVLHAQFYKVEIDAEEFAAVTRPMLRRAPWLLSFSWLPRVPLEQREAFEWMLSGSGAGQRSIREQGAGRAPSVAVARSEYFPRRWLEPQRPQEDLIGLDLSVDPWRAGAVAHAAQDREVSASLPFVQEVHGTGRRLAVELFSPVDDLRVRAGQSESAQIRADFPVRGLVSTTIDLALLAQTAAAQARSEGLQWLLRDPAMTGSRGLSWDGSQLSDADPGMEGRELRSWQSGWHEGISIRLADRHWNLWLRPARGFGAAGFGLDLATGAVGLGFTALLAAYLLTRRQRELEARQARAGLEAQVAERTAELAEANVHLRGEVEERRSAEESLRLFRRLVDSAGQGMGMASLDRRVIYMNPRMRLEVGEPDWQKDRQRDFLDYYPDTARARIEAEVLPAMLRGEDWSGEFEMPDRRGRGSHWILASFFVLKDAGGAPQYFANTVTDLTQRRRLELRLREAREQADSANQAKSVFLANMSHEIRTPLNAVLGYTQLMLEERDLAPLLRQRMTTILEAGQRLLRLINDVLDLSKIEAGSLQMHDEVFEPRRELEQLLALFTPKAQLKGLTLQAQLHLEAGERCHADRVKFGQIVSNLLGNAIKFTAHGEVELKAWRDGSELFLTVCDQGPGISEAEQADIFTAFRQGSAGRSQGGTGLGLVLTRRFVQAMGGEVKLRSVPDQGSCFDVSLKLPALTGGGGTDSAAGAASCPVEGLDPATPRRVLVVEDDADSRELLAATLRRIGCEVVTAEDGQAALQACARQAFDLVFSDIRMPRMDGSEMLRRLRSNPATARVPVLAVTASSLAHERRDYLAQGFCDFIGKPYLLEQIHAALEQFTGARLLRSSPGPSEHLHSMAADPVGLQGAGESPTPTGPSSNQAAGAELLSVLTRLGEAAALGDLDAVHALLGELAPPRLTPGTYELLMQAANTYDLERIEAQVAALRGGTVPSTAEDTPAAGGNSR